MPSPATSPPGSTSSMRKQFPFGIHPGVAMVAQWIETLPAKTGRSLDQWIALLNRECPADENLRRTWLKEKHGLGTNSAIWLAERSLGRGAGEDSPEAYLRSAENYVNAMFAGPKSALLPVYNALMDAAYALGPEVRACPCKTIVPLYRNHVFAQIKPTTRTRIDLGLALGDTPAEAPIIDTGGFAKKDRITHRIPLSSPKEIDATVLRWLRRAYQKDA